MNKTIIVIPTLNEYENVEILLANFLTLDVDVVFIDDNSTDQTDQIIENNIHFDKKYFLIKRETKLGYASAVIEGINFGVNNKYETIVQMDADLSHSIEDLQNLLQSSKRSDVIIGSRYVLGGKIVGWGLFRKYLSYFANLSCRRLLKMEISDFTSGFRVYNAKVFSEIDLKNINAEGYSFLVEVIYKIYLKNFSISETPILFNDRKYGSSKLNKIVIFESIINLIRLSTKGIN
ncbi:MAG: polyprenol monophosphomannose synthase [Flavobacteriales bacterium]|nr:polyprenol monophosphomannose synthase [Flavobacteriales bacterium]